MNDDPNSNHLSFSRIDEIRAVWNRRWNWFHKPIHAVAHVLHPLWRDEEQYSNAELEEGFMEYVRRITGDDVDMTRRIEDDLLTFRNNSLHFGRPTARLRETQLSQSLSRKNMGIVPLLWYVIHHSLYLLLT